MTVKAILALLASLGAAAFAVPLLAIAQDQSKGGGLDDSNLVASREGADPETVAAAERGLRWLAQNQTADGCWMGKIGFKLNQNYEVEAENVPHVGVTALSAMAFLAGGHLPERGEYGPVIDRATRYLLSCVDDGSGFVSSHGSRMYSHAFATLYLGEVLGMSKNPEVRAKLQRAVDLIVRSQNAHGSWRYEPLAVESDMSITVCQLMALRAARNVGIKVPRSTIDRAVTYVQRSYVSREDANNFESMIDNYYFLRKGSFKYQLMDNTRSSYALTAAGIASLYNAGVYSDNRLDESLGVLWESYDLVQDLKTHFFFWYGQYYAVQAFYVAGDPWWPRYWTRIRKDLLSSQQRDGRWVNDVGPGDAFSTAVASIILQVPYRYLPILQR